MADSSRSGKRTRRFLPGATGSVALPLVALRVAGQGGEFAAFVIFARRLGTAPFGRLAVAFLICRYAGLVADWGASVRGPRDVVAPTTVDEVGALARRRELATAVLVAGYVVVTLAMGHGELVALGVTIASRGLARDWLALGNERGWRAGMPSAVQGLVLLGGSLFAHTPRGAATAIAVAYAVALALSLRLNPLPRAPRDARVQVTPWILIAVLADQVTASTDTVLLAALRSASEAGIYAAVYRIPNAWMTLLGLAVIAFVPSTARVVSQERSRLLELRNRAVRVGGAAAAVVLVSIPISWAIVPHLFGDAFRSGRTALVVLLLATAVNALAAPLHPVYLALGRDRTQAVVTLSAAGLNLVANLLVIPAAGMVGAASTTLAAQTLLLVLFWRGITRAIDVPDDAPH